MFTIDDYNKFRELRVTHLAARFEDLITDETNDDLTPEQLFLTATADALELRHANFVNGLVKKADFPIPTASVAEIDYQEGRGITKVRMQRYADHNWDNATLNVIITSPSGGGKTYLVCALGIAACHNGYSVAYTRMDDLARSLIIARGDSIKHQTLLNKYSNVALLIIDDFMTVGIDQDAAADLFTILANREHRAATMIASQSGPEYWVDALPDKVAADSIVNRLVNHAKKITLGEVDMRRERSEQARQAPGYWE
ncbi:ATP-binding protein [Leucobacter sp. HY1910]